ncbi:MAG: sensor histidine kinase, partial [Acidobacteria bacterium ACB2]|nr:sensor histidine kinase [Acidobacteria bacterium ACB2]
TGPGIPEGTDPFEPRPVAETEDERAGIGLSIVRELAAAMGGRVEARSLPEGGACFSVVLPKAPQERPAA